MRKIIFLDVDGTLVDYENNLPDSAVRAIRQARERGHLVYICTGRSKAEVYQNIWDIGLDGMIGGNGSYVEDRGEVILQQVMSLEDCTAVVDWLDARGLDFYLESNNGLFASEGFEDNALDTMKAYAKRKHLGDVEGMTVRSVFPDMIFDGNLYRDDLNKVSFILKSYQDFIDAKEAFPNLEANTWGGKDEEALFGDLGVKDINKAYAIYVLLEHLKADVKDTIAFGDAKIDIPMLEYCAYGVSMGNGGTEIKAMADYITDDVDQNGLWNAFMHLGLIE